MDVKIIFFISFFHLKKGVSIVIYLKYVTLSDFKCWIYDFNLKKYIYKDLYGRICVIEYFSKSEIMIVKRSTNCQDNSVHAIATMHFSYNQCPYATYHIQWRTIPMHLNEDKWCTYMRPCIFGFIHIIHVFQWWYPW